MFEKANLEQVEILNLSGSFANDRVPWDRATVGAMLDALQRSKSRVYALNLGEIYFQEDALVELHRRLQETWIGFIFIEPITNNIDTKKLKGCFRRTTEIDKRLYPNGSNSRLNDFSFRINSKYNYSILKTGVVMDNFIYFFHFAYISRETI